MKYIDTGAVISKCEKYRYKLWREWRDYKMDKPRTCAFVMLNPSTADANSDDATIRRCVRFAHREGCSRLEVVNLFAYRATNPTLLGTVTDPVGPDNEIWLRDTVRSAHLVVCGWGSHGVHLQGKLALIETLLPYGNKVKCFGRTLNGQPKHPLYLSGDRQLVDFF